MSREGRNIVGTTLKTLAIYIYIYIYSFMFIGNTILQMMKWRHGNIQFISVAQSCLTVCDPMNHSTPGLPVHHQLPESTQTHVHRVSDAIQPSHPLLSPFSSCPQSFPASGSFQMSQLSSSGGQSIGVSASTSVLPMNIQD